MFLSWIHRMKRVIVSVDKRKKFNNTMTPTALGIQSIIIGPNFKEEMKSPIDEELDDDHRIDVEYQSENPKTAKLKPINHSVKPQSGISERMKEVIRSQASIKSGN